MAVKILQHNDTPNLVVIGAVISYPNIFAARLNDLSGDMEFSYDLLIPKTTDMGDYKKVIAMVSEDKWGSTIPEFKNKHLKDGDLKIKDGEIMDGYADNWFITIKMKEAKGKPTIVDLAKNPLTSADAIAGGDFVNSFFSVYAYDRGGNRGIGFGINTVQLKELGARFGGGASSASAMDALDAFADDDMGI